MSKKHSVTLVTLNDNLAVNANDIVFIASAKSDDEDKRPRVQMIDGTLWRVGGGVSVREIVNLISKAKSRDVSVAVEKRVAKVLDEFMAELRREAPRLLNPVSVGTPTVLSEGELEWRAHESE